MPWLCKLGQPEREDFERDGRRVDGLTAVGVREVFSLSEYCVGCKCCVQGDPKPPWSPRLQWCLSPKGPIGVHSAGLLRGHWATQLFDYYPNEDNNYLSQLIIVSIKEDNLYEELRWDRGLLWVWGQSGLYNMFLFQKPKHKTKKIQPNKYSKKFLMWSTDSGVATHILCFFLLVLDTDICMNSYSYFPPWLQ